MVMWKRPKAPGVPTRHTAFIYDKGGNTRLFQIRRPVQVEYSRVRDDTSDATVTVLPTDRDDQLRDLDSVEPGRHELHIFRGQSLAWCGPVNLPASQNVYGNWEVTAKDLTFYLDRTVMVHGFDNSGTKADYVVNRIKNILNLELTYKETLGWNLKDHLHFYVQDGDARTSTTSAPWSMTVFDHLDDLAAHNGIDYTVVGRELHVWDTSRAAMGQTPTVTRKDFLDEPTIKKYGTELATRVIATDGQGGFGVAGGTDPYYGEWDIVVQAYDEDSDAALPTAAELQQQAVLSLKGRNPTPMSLTVPENSGLSPDSALTWDMLTPGAYVPLQLDMGNGPVQRMQKLQNVQVTDNADGEQIQISLYPASGYGSDDNTVVV